MTIDELAHRMEDLAAERREELAALSTSLAVLTAHVMGNGGPSMNERLTTIEQFESAEHGAIRFLAIGVPIFVSGIGVIAAVLKLLG